MPARLGEGARVDHCDEDCSCANVRADNGVDTASTLPRRQRRYKQAGCRFIWAVVRNLRDDAMNMSHVTPFLDGMHARDATALAEHLSEEIVLNSPFVTAPFVGREPIMGVLRVPLSGVDEFASTAVITGEKRAAVVLCIRAGDVEVTGIDDMTVDDDGLITSMSVQWRPLEQIVAIQRKLAPLIGVPALKLVEVGAA
jgi:hypothetical protein